MTFLRGLWHGLKVLGVALYAVLTVGLVWAGLAQLGTSPRWGWACLAVVLAVFAARGLIHNRGVGKGASYVVAAGFYLAFLLIAAAMN